MTEPSNQTPRGSLGVRHSPRTLTVLPPAFPPLPAGKALLDRTPPALASRPFLRSSSSCPTCGAARSLCAPWLTGRGSLHQAALFAAPRGARSFPPSFPGAFPSGEVRGPSPQARPWLGCASRQLSAAFLAGFHASALGPWPQHSSAGISGALSGFPIPHLVRHGPFADHATHLGKALGRRRPSLPFPLLPSLPGTAHGTGGLEGSCKLSSPPAPA